MGKRRHMTRAERRAERERMFAPRHACPCCAYVTLAERGRYEICPICFWEDEDHWMDDEPNQSSAANHGLTLNDARRNFAKIGACDPKMLQHVLPPDQRSAFRHQPRQE